MSRLTRLAAALFALLLLMNLGLTSAFAAAPGWAGEMNDSALQKALSARTEDMREVGKRVALAEAYNMEVKAVIVDLQTVVPDTECLCGAQATFEHQLRHIEAQLATANSLIAAHPGFDAKGRVVDRTVARRTISTLNDLRRDIWAYGGDIYVNMHRGFVSIENMYPDVLFVEPERPTQRSLIS